MSATDHTLTDAEWREFQAVPEQGYSHRAWVDAKIAARLTTAEAEKEALRAEQDRWKVLAENLRGASHRAESAEAALAGLVAKIKALAGEWDEVANKWHYAVWHESQKANARDLRALIPADAATALDAVREKAWDKGYTSGHSNAMRQMSDEPGAPTTPNPYRVEEV